MVVIRADVVLYTSRMNEGLEVYYNEDKRMHTFTEKSQNQA